MKKFVDILVSSTLAQAGLTLFLYAFYGVILGMSLTPSLYLLWHGKRVLSVQPEILGFLAFAIFCGLALFLFFIAGILVMGTTIRLLTLGIKPGNYPFASLTMFRWMIYSGLYHLAGSTILTYIPMSFLGTLFFRILGAKIGKNVRLNTWFLNDPYLLEMGDNVVIGGKTDVSCHTVEPGKLILQNVKIGNNTLIGQHCYISPGVTIGNRCVIGQYAFVRKNTEVPDRTIISAIAGLPIRQVAKFENSLFRSDATTSSSEPQ